jgi:hypothetical protein
MVVAPTLLTAIRRPCRHQYTRSQVPLHSRSQSSFRVAVRASTNALARAPLQANLFLLISLIGCGLYCEIKLRGALPPTPLPSPDDDEEAADSAATPLLLAYTARCGLDLPKKHDAAEDEVAKVE